MALMLRMVGIPARVAAGFAPGSLNRDSGEFRVRDLDAHAWVEVYFNGIGWVTFDPTPPAAPAQSRTSGLGAPTAAPASSPAELQGARRPAGAPRLDPGGPQGAPPPQDQRHRGIRRSQPVAHGRVGTRTGVP